MTKKDDPLAEKYAFALEILEKWNDVTGAINEESSWWLELQSIIEDAVYIGAHGKPPESSREFLDGAGDRDEKNRPPSRQIAITLSKTLKGDEMDRFLVALKTLRWVRAAVPGPPPRYVRISSGDKR